MKSICIIRTHFTDVLPVNRTKLTVLGDKSDAAVHDDGDAILGQLLVAERLAVCAGGQRDGRVPQREVRLVEAVDVNRPVKSASDNMPVLNSKNKICSLISGEKKKKKRNAAKSLKNNHHQD